MDIHFDNKKVGIYRNFVRQSRQTQEIAESVVPDVNEDIGKIAAVKSSVLLKSKDVTARGVIVSGEAQASLIYITETQDKVSYVKISKGFTIEYELPEITAETVAQVNLSILSTEARVVNPRKVSVCFDICGELCCYIPDELCVESGFSMEAHPGLHAKYETKQLNVVSAVCEKTFSLSDQFVFPNGKPKPAKLISGSIDFVINDTQSVGTKLIVKGNADIGIIYLSDEVNYPVKTEFSTSFSQIIDIAEENVDSCVVCSALTACYFDIGDSIGGDKLLDVELHAVLQLVCHHKRELAYVSDVYSNLVNTDCVRENSSIEVVKEIRKTRLSADERLNIMDDCTDILSLFVSLNRIIQEPNKLKASVNVDVVYRTESAQLSSARRSMEMETDWNEEYQITSSIVNDVYFRPDGQYLDGHLSMDISYIVRGSEEIEKIVSVELKEDEPIASENSPSVSLVRCGGESLWELAKTYRSSEERIKAFNEIEGDISGRMLLIPKCI